MTCIEIIQQHFRQQHKLNSKNCFLNTTLSPIQWLQLWKKIFIHTQQVLLEKDVKKKEMLTMSIISINIMSLVCHPIVPYIHKVYLNYQIFHCFTLTYSVLWPIEISFNKHVFSLSLFWLCVCFNLSIYVTIILTM